ncbi:MAG: type IX secretion system membrane protein PorP/SprF [Salibacteraceae bacterium]
MTFIMKRLSLFLFILILIPAAGFAQQLEQWTQYYLNEYAVNPSLAGGDKYFRANAMFRNQWQGIVGAPRTYYMSIHGPVFGERMGLGGAVYSDVAGALSKNGLQLSYSYHLKLNQDLRLSFSLAGMFFQWAVNGSELDLDQPDDIAIGYGNMVAWIPDFGFGSRFYGKNFHIGFYIPQIAASKIQLFSDYPLTESQLNRHYYFNAGYKHYFSSDIALEGNFLARYIRPVYVIEPQMRFIYKDMVWLGTSVRMPIQGEVMNAVGVMVGYEFENNLVIGYSYDIDVNRIGAVSNGSHEIVLGIKFTRKNPKPPVSDDE